VRVKICGIRSEADLWAAVEAGADAIGVLVGVTAKTEDELSPAKARQLISAAPPFISTALVTHLSDPAQIAALIFEVGADLVQLHGEMTATQVAAVRRRLTHTKIIRAIHFGPDTTLPNAVARVHSIERSVDALIFDTRGPDRLGGTGVTHDWAVSSKVARVAGLPVVLAGGLNEDNVAEAVQLFRPWAVDVNSGVEDRHGNKDLTCCRRFVNLAKELPAEFESGR
jgi:phosphoribosylanthranilate isomerase